jgi:hypothetical protein
LQDVLVGETGFEPATARPPAGRIGLIRTRFRRCRAVRADLSCGWLRSVWTPDWTP